MSEWNGQILKEVAPELFGNLVFLERCGSTNDEARELASCGAPHGTVVVTEHQTAGRGRRARPWHCPPGEGIACSLILRPADPPALWARTAIAAGLGVTEALDLFGLQAELKWPNDLWVKRRKLCGILTESSGKSVVIGLGLNVNVTVFPNDLQHPATSMKLETGSSFSREEILTLVVNKVLARCELIGSHFSEIIEAWNLRCALRGHRIRLTLSNKSESLEGLMKGLSSNGELLLQANQKLHQISHAEEVRLLE